MGGGGKSSGWSDFSRDVGDALDPSNKYNTAFRRGFIGRQIWGRTPDQIAADNAANNVPAPPPDTGLSNVDLLNEAYAERRRQQSMSGRSATFMAGPNAAPPPTAPKTLLGG